MLLQAGKEGKTENTETYHLLSIPRGGEFTMTLADGTRVWLNSESELHFPLQFGGEQRIVQLTGEAYFEVAKDAAHPFVVEVCDSKIQVLGTGFNVRSYSEEGQIVTTLVEGAVCFESIEDRVILKPGEQSILDKEGQLQKRVVEVYPFVAWKEGRFIFRTSVDDMFFAYSRPQDMGNRMETDWIALSKPQEDQALWVGASSPRAPLEVSVLRYTPKELNDARSLDRLPEKNKVIVNLDAFQMGLGGSSCGPRPLAKYQTLSGAIALGFVLAPSSALLNLARTGLVVPHSPVIERDGDGMVSLTSSTPEAEIKYSVNKGPEKTYRNPFKLPEGEVRAWAASVKSGKVPSTSPGERKFPLVKGQGEWKILSASSEEPDTGFAHFAIDGNPDTCWHTSYTNGLPGFPHSIAVDMGTRMKFTGFIYTPRMDKDKGLISQYTFSVSDDGRNWREVKKGQFSYHYIRKDPAVQRIDFGRPVEARYFKLDARSPVRGGEQSATVAELNIITQ